MNTLVRTLLAFILMGALIYAAFYFSVANYKECKAQDFSTRYCVLTHIIK